MNKMRRALVIIFLLLLAFAAVFIFAGKEASEKNEASPTQGQTAQEETGEETEEKIKVPNFTALDEEGNEVELYDFLGKPIVLNFWASWCGPCRAEMPDFESAYKEYGDKINFLMVNLTDGSTETVESASEFIGLEGFSFPLLFDSTQEAAYLYGVYSIPMTFFIDAEGYLVARASGSINGEMLKSGLYMLID